MGTEYTMFVFGLTVVILTVQARGLFETTPVAWADPTENRTPVSSPAPVQAGGLFETTPVAWADPMENPTPVPSPAPVEGPNYANLKLRLTWPPSYCKIRSCHQSPSYFVIHGLWPNQKRCRARRFDIWKMVVAHFSFYFITYNVDTGC